MQKLLTTLLALSTLVPVYTRQTNKKEPSSCTDEFSFKPTESSKTFLTSILNPITFEEFFEHHFQHKAANAQRPGLPTYYGPMASFEDVEYAIENGFQISNPNQRLVYGKDWKLAKRVLKEGEHWTGLYASQEESGELGLTEAMQAVSKGFTVIMNGVQSSMPNVYQSAWQLETALGWHVNVNLYISPSPKGGTQGFEAHFDWMDGFIFQIAGTKVRKGVPVVCYESLLSSCHAPFPFLITLFLFLALEGVRASSGDLSPA
jgi:hypothetical protein